MERTVEFPEKDESTGEVLINYMGPRNDNFVESKACTLCPVLRLTHLHDAGNRCSGLLSYFFSYCTSQQRVHRDRIPSLVCIVDPYLKIALTACSTFIYIGEDHRATHSDLMIYVGSVPTEHLDTFDAKLHESFSRIIKDGVDLNRMKMVIDRDERQVFFRSIELFSTYSNSFQVPQQNRISWGRHIFTSHDCRLPLWAVRWLSNRGSLG
jgi:hypothetical protein